MLTTTKTLGSIAFSLIQAKNTGLPIPFSCTRHSIQAHFHSGPFGLSHEFQSLSVLFEKTQQQ